VLPTWLPPMLATDGVWDQVLDRLYSVFQKDFIIDGCSYEGLPVRFDARKEEGKYEEGFWHLVTKHDPEAGYRVLDPARARRLPWCKATIEQHPPGDTRVWRTREGARIRVYLWLVALDYVVVLEERSRIVILVTAYSVDGDRTRTNLQRKYDARIP